MNSKLYLLCSHIELHGVYFHDVLATVSCLSNRLSHSGNKQFYCSTSPQKDLAISPNRPIKPSVPLQSSNSTHHFCYFPVYSCLLYGNVRITWSGSISTMLLFRSVWAGGMVVVTNVVLFLSLFNAEFGRDKNPKLENTE